MKREKYSRLYQFIVITYNHEKLILDHLKSIKYQIEKYGHDKEIVLTVVDDCSQDNTISVVKDYIEENKKLFQHTMVIVNDENIGIKYNWLKSINSIISYKFKILAGDDVYLEQSNIFEFMDYCYGKNLVFSPIYISGKLPLSQILYTGKLIFLSNYPKLIRKLIKNNINFFYAPGSFISKDILSSLDYQEHLISSDRDYEDWPSWIFLFVKNSTVYHVSKVPYVDYRPSGSREDASSLSLIQVIKSKISKIYHAFKKRINLHYGWILLISEIYGLYYVIYFHFRVIVNKKKN